MYHFICNSDTLLYETFCIEKFVDKYKALQQNDSTSCLALYTECEDKGKTSILTIII